MIIYSRKEYTNNSSSLCLSKISHFLSKLIFGITNLKICEIGIMEKIQEGETKKAFGPVNQVKMIYIFRKWLFRSENCDTATVFGLKMAAWPKGVIVCVCVCERCTVGI